MNGRKPVYNDLLNHGITAQQLQDFISKLLIRNPDNSFVAVRPDTEVDQPVTYRDFSYQTGLCYATEVNAINMVKALLAIGADPNEVSTQVVRGSALLLAAHPKKPKPEILTLLLNHPDIDIFVFDGLTRTAFRHTRGNATAILRLLEADVMVASLPTEEKTAIAAAIASTMKPFDVLDTSSVQTRQTNLATCEGVKKAYSDEHKNRLSEEIKATPLHPVSLVVSSYLFKPKPRFLREMENWCADRKLKAKTEKIEEEVKQEVVRQKTSCSVM